MMMTRMMMMIIIMIVWLLWWSRRLTKMRWCYLFLFFTCRSLPNLEGQTVFSLLPTFLSLKFYCIRPTTTTIDVAELTGPPSALFAARAAAFLLFYAFFSGSTYIHTHTYTNTAVVVATSSKKKRNKLTAPRRVQRTNSTTSNLLALLRLLVGYKK